ncbi:MAG: hypothetical protein J1E39_01270 [Eubacterium sp.]|nr:hypothetical protein [Eubacterium sp.]
MNFKEEVDVVLGKAKELTDTGIKKTDEVIKISRLKLQCIKLDSRIKEKYTKLGKNVYNMVKQDTADSDVIASAVVEIEQLYKQMAALRKRIEEMKRIITCPVCGTKNKFNSEYCTQCAHRLVVTDVAPDGYGYDDDDEMPF